jgi:hypothetical protein
MIILESMNYQSLPEVVPQHLDDQQTSDGKKVFPGLYMREGEWASVVRGERSVQCGV